MKLQMVLFILCMLLNTMVLANDSKMHLAAFNSDLVVITEANGDDIDEEIGSTDTSDFDNRIGAFSREDGAMDGAYGDGEFAD